MKTLIAIPVFLFLAGGAGIYAAGPSWIAGHTTEVQVRNNQFALVRTVSGRSEIEELAGCLRRAARVGEIRDAFKWSHKFYIAGEKPEKGSWLYESGAGDFTRLSVAVSPIYRLPDADRARFNRILELDLANRPVKRTPGTNPPGEAGGH